MLQLDSYYIILLKVCIIPEYFLIFLARQFYITFKELMIEVPEYSLGNKNQIWARYYHNKTL